MGSLVEKLKSTSFREAMGMTDKEYHKWLKKEVRGETPCGTRDKLAHSMQEGTLYQRVRVDEDGEGWKLYGFVMGEQFADYYTVDSTHDLTDEDIWEFFDDSMWVSISEGWDCTGKPFTQYIHWHRNPDGAISYVHKMALDV